MSDCPARDPAATRGGGTALTAARALRLCFRGLLRGRPLLPRARHLSERAAAGGADPPPHPHLRRLLRPRRIPTCRTSWRRSQGHVVSYYPIVPGLLNIPAYLIAPRRGRVLRSAGQPPGDRQGDHGVGDRLRRSPACTCSSSASCPTVGRREADRAALRFALLYALRHLPVADRVAGAVAARPRPDVHRRRRSPAWSRPESRLFPLAGFLLGMAVWNRPVVGLLRGAAGAVRRSSISAPALLTFAPPPPFPALAMGIYSATLLGVAVGARPGASASSGDVPRPPLRPARPLPRRPGRRPGEPGARPVRLHAGLPARRPGAGALPGASAAPAAALHRRRRRRPDRSSSPSINVWWGGTRSATAT